MKEEDGAAPEWAMRHDIKMDETICWVSDLATQLAAVRAQMGVTILPCFVGDKDPNLMRVPNSSIEYYGGIWLLAHGETRKTKRVRLFRDFIKNRMNRYSKQLDGSSYDEAASSSTIL